jgi:23S rRNA U2552 (ribose-2'-O)-methylase RlmE/FtsJ
MLELPLTRPRGRVPPIASWLQPNYPGPGEADTLVRLGMVEGLNLPDSVSSQRDFPEYWYPITALQTLKRRLNETKRLMDPIERKEAGVFRQFQAAYRPYDPLKGERGILVREYGAEVVTNAWLKMYELCHSLEPRLVEVAKHRTKERAARLHTVHLAEAPGNFLLSINHYLQTQHPRMSWDWLSNTYRSPLVGVSADRGYLADTYGLMRRYGDRWMYGSECDGDITSGNNLNSFQATVDSQGWLRHRADLVTSDVKYVPHPPNYDEEEIINRAVQCGHLAGAWACLAPGGTAVLKEFTHMESASVSMLYLAVLSFDRVSICKPESSRGPNSETYLKLEGRRKDLSEVWSHGLMTYLRYIRYMNHSKVQGAPSLLRMSDIPTSFVEQVEAIETQLATTQIEAIKTMLDTYDQWKAAGGKGSLVDERPSREWLRTYVVKPLDPAARMLG